MLLSEQLNYYTTNEKVFQVLQYFTRAVILRCARRFCGALFKCIVAWKRGVSKRQFKEIVSSLVVFHLPYGKYKGVKMILFVPLSKSNFFTSVAVVSFVQYSCCTRVVLVSLVTHSCCSCLTRVSLVSLVSGTRVANQTRSCLLCKQFTFKTTFAAPTFTKKKYLLPIIKYCRYQNVFSKVFHNLRSK